MRLTKRKLSQLRAWLVFGGSFKLRPYEVVCLDGWGGALSNEAQRLLKTQRASLDRYKRLSGDRVVMFFSTSVRNGENLASDMRFPLREEESRVATVRMVFDKARRMSVKATIALSQGELLSLEFNKSPSEFRSLRIESVLVELHRDVMNTAPERQSRSGIPSEIQAQLGEKARLLGDANEPLPNTLREAIVQSLGAVLPEPYLAWTEAADGFRVGAVRVLGLQEIWSAPRPDGQFCVVATVDGQADLAVRAGDGLGELYWLGYEDGRAVKYTGGLLRVIEQCAAAEEPGEVGVSSKGVR